MKNQKINISEYAKFMLKSEEFTTQKNPEQVDLIRLTVKDLGFPNGATIEKIYQRAEELGLELCPAEVGPHLRLNYQDQSFDEWLHIGMEQISGPGGSPGVFGLGRRGDGLWLDRRWARPGRSLASWRRVSVSSPQVTKRNLEFL